MCGAMMVCTDTERSMKTLLGRFVVIAALGTAGAAGAQTGMMPGSQIVTSGTAEARVAPDRATIFIGVQSKATTAAAAGGDNARRQKAVIDTLRALGLAAEQIATINYSVNPDMQYNQATGTSRVTGYTVSNTVRAELRRVEDVGRTIDAALAKGANEVSSLQFTSSKADSVRRAALASAVVAARADAEALARAAGGSLGNLIELSTGQSPIRPMPMEANMAMMKAGGVATPIEPGQQTFSASVTGRWVFVPR
jgi:uncharacterized protein YggE